MALDSYSGLQAEIALWLNREDLTAQIPTFITLLEARMNRELRTREMETRATATLAEQFVPLPADYLSMKQLQLNTDPVQPLQFVTATDLDYIRRDNNDVAGRPFAFSIVDEQIEVAPVPDASYELEMLYHGKITALSGTVSSNWVLEKHPDLYLYGSLLQAAPYLHDDDRIPVWRDLVDNPSTGILEQIRLADERARAGNSPLIRRIRKPYGR